MFFSFFNIFFLFLYGLFLTPDLLILCLVIATSGVGAVKDSLLSEDEHWSIAAIKASSSDKTAKKVANIFISLELSSSPNAIANVDAKIIKSNELKSQSFESEEF